MQRKESVEFNRRTEDSVHDSAPIFLPLCGQQHNIFKLDLRKATVITLYLLPEMNDQLVPQLEKLKNGSRIVSHEFGFEGVQHDKLITIKSQADGVPRDIYLYTLPLRKVGS